ncbi:hypothetical protein llap_4247 [Limosa lapponica baueri]|uniref:Uncharacterized protein n=1 Tax=Limosa lapponica baueri TaxID=1758121 RepID=A0A2I0UHC6_LIMLA|nr:hypothetical protein llap_4247 [Limosa lapponica baueri]
MEESMMDSPMCNSHCSWPFNIDENMLRNREGTCTMKSVFRELEDKVAGFVRYEGLISLNQGLDFLKGLEVTVPCLLKSTANLERRDLSQYEVAKRWRLSKEINKMDPQK